MTPSAPLESPASYFMQKRAPLLLATLAFGLLACNSTTDATDELGSGGIILPDTATVDGVLQMRFAANAFDRAPRLSLDSANAVMIEGGDNLDFDLTGAQTPRLFADGRLLVGTSGAESRLLLFDADGTPLRVLARNGSGPGEVGMFITSMRMSGDTVVVADMMNRRRNLVTADSGIVHSEGYAIGANAFCKQPLAMLPDRTTLAFSVCEEPMDLVEGDFTNSTLVTLSFDHSEVDTVTVLSGPEVREVQLAGMTRQMPIRFSGSTLATFWGDHVATNSEIQGYRFDRRSMDGSLLAQLVVERPRRSVTGAMIEAQMDGELGEMDGADAEGIPTEMKEQVEGIIEGLANADSLPGFAKLYSGNDGALWAVNFKGPVDSSWSAVAFDGDGSMVGVLTVSTELGELVSIQDRKVILKSTDDDGFISFGVYAVLND
jgi:hypothetical protein